MKGATELRSFHVGSGLVGMVFLLVGSGCASAGGMEMQGSQRLAAEVRSVLGSTNWPSPEYQRARTRFQEMGPEVDPILVVLIEDVRARVDARAEALVLLAERGSPLALPILSRALGYENEHLRSAAVIGLSRLAPNSDDALELIRAATRDRARLVRLNALQALDIREVETIRTLLEREADPEVRQVAIQLVSLAEARGARLSPDRRGTLRTAGDIDQPQIVFRPFTNDSIAEVATGDLRLELPEGRDIPLAASARVVGNVVPAFFAPDRSAVVFEDGGLIRIVDIDSRAFRELGPGIAPRLIPFTQSFVFLREKPGIRRFSPAGSEVRYDVYRSSFIGEEIELIGELRGWVHDDRHGGEAPVRWMVVGDAGESFMLHGEGLEPFPIPGVVWTGMPD